MKKALVPSENLRIWIQRAHARISGLLPFPERDAPELRAMRRTGDPWVLHISDTPTSFYRPLKQLILLLAPRGIIHTGDLADEVKIDLSPEDLPLYRRRIQTLGAFLDSPHTYIVLGNHDNLQEASRAFPQSTLFGESGVVSLEGVTFALSHGAKDLPRGRADYYLYGHDETPPPENMEDRYCNGLKKIGCCNLHTREWCFFSYPSYVGEGRSKKFRLGL
jgi:predicted phosphodiesterase